MSNLKKRIVAVVLIVALLASLIVINVSAIEYVPMPDDLDLPRTMAAVYELYEQEQITGDDLAAYLKPINVFNPEYSRVEVYWTHIMSISTDKKTGSTTITKAQSSSDYGYMRTLLYPETDSNEVVNNYHYLWGGFMSSCTTRAQMQDEWDGDSPIGGVYPGGSAGYHFGKLTTNRYDYSNKHLLRFDFRAYSNFTLEQVTLSVVDHKKPGADGWKAELVETGDAEATTYQLRLSCKSGDKLRPANEKIAYDELTGLQLAVTMKSTVTGQEYTIPAKAANVDRQYLYFDFYGDDWINMGNEQLQITGIQSTTTEKGSYEIYDVYHEDSLTERFGFTSEYPVTDFAGNQLVFDAKEFSVSFDKEQMYIDRELAIVKELHIRPSCVNYENTTGESDWSESFLGPYSYVYGIELILNEALLEDDAVEDAAAGNVYLEWNISQPVKDENGKYVMENGELVYEPLRTYLRHYYNRTDGDGNVQGVLYFNFFRIDSGARPQGQRLVANKIVGAELLCDRVGNFGLQNPELMTGDDATSIWPDYKVFIDTVGPDVEVGNTVIRWKDSAGKEINIDEYTDDLTKISDVTSAIQITVPIKVTDHRPEGATVAGAAGTTGYLALSNPQESQQISYRYAVTQSTAFPGQEDAVWYTGTLAGSDRTDYSTFGVGAEGTNVYLHLELSDLSKYEISDTKGLNLHLTLADAVNNRSFKTRIMTGMYVDNVAPTAAIHKLPAKTTTTGGVFSADITANDMNGIASISYAWLDNEGDTPTYTDITVDGSNTATRRVSLDVTAGGEVTKLLKVQVYDIYGNCTETGTSFTADLSKAISRYELTGDITLPCANPGILISAPGATTSGADVTGAMSRASIAYSRVTDQGQVVYEIYYRLFDSTAESQELFAYGDGITWYHYTSPTMNPGNYPEEDVEIIEGGVPGWASYYGNLEVYVASSLNGLSYAGSLQKLNDATYSYEKIGTVAYAPARDDVHSLRYNTASNGVLVLQDAYGNTATALIARDDNGEMLYRYCKFNQDMTGFKATVSLSNALVQDWGVGDIDFVNSYAVLAAVDESGNILTNEDGSYTEVSNRLPLDRSLTQNLTVPALDKDGNELPMGAYTWVVYVAQKGGGSQLFDDCELYLLLDNADAPDNFGVLSYTSRIEAAWGGDSVIGKTQSNADGSPLSTVNIGVGQVSEMTYNGISNVTVHELEGITAYSTGTFNSLSNQHGYTPETTVTITADLSKEEDHGTWLGQELGAVKGIRFWNKASTGGLAEYIQYVTADLSYQGNHVSAEFSSDGSKAQLDINFYCGWYYDSMANCIVDQEALADRSPGAFALTLGRNTICYQLVMENGTQSPIYQFDLNLITEAPDVEVEFDYGPYFTEVYSLVDDSGSEWVYTDIDVRNTEYIDVHFTNVETSYSGLQVYYCQFNETNGNYDIHQLTADELANGYRITNGCHNRREHSHKAQAGYEGTRSAYTYGGHYNYGTDCFFMVADDSGNAIGVYPMDEYEYGQTITSDIAATSAEYGGIYGTDVDMYYSQYAGLHTVLFDNVDYVETLDMQIDDREIASLSPNGDIPLAPNYAGAAAVEYDAYKDGNRYDALLFGAPYDPNVAEGEMLPHTVTVTARGEDDSFVLTETMEFMAENIKPAIISAATYAGYVELTFNTPVVTQYSGAGNVEHLVIRDDSLYGTSYDVTFQDLYGNTYTQTVEIGEVTDPKITYSTVDPTTGSVTVTVSSAEPLYVKEDSLGEYNEDYEWMAFATVEGNGTTELKLIFSQNGGVSVFSDEEKRTGIAHIDVSNIYATLEVDPYIVWDYNAGDIQKGNTVYGEVTAYLVDRNGAVLLDPATGNTAKWVFYPGGETEHTFTGCVSDRGTPVPDTTAVLAVKLDNEPVEEKDVYAPDVDVVSYVTYLGKAQEAGLVYRASSGRYDMTDYKFRYGNDYYDDMTEMVAGLGWADSYMFHFDVYDESRVKLILRSDLYEENITYSTASQTVKGVSLVGRTLEITENGEFMLYLVDEQSNVTAIHFKVTTLSDAPVPTVEQVLAKDENGNYVVRAYLLPPQLEGLTDLTLENVDARVDTDSYEAEYDESVQELYDLYSSYLGCSYILCKENGTYPMNYSYSYRGVTHSGTVNAVVTMINNTVPTVVSSSWSHNYYEEATNQDVILQQQLNIPVQSVSAVYVKDGQYYSISDLEMTDAGVIITCFQKDVTVHYENSTAALEEKYGTVYLKLVGLENNVVGYHALPSVTTIDRTAPTAVDVQVAYSENRKTAVITIITDEAVVSQNVNKKGTSFQFTVRENGTYTYDFTDAAGNMGTVEAVVDGLVTEPLVILLKNDAGVLITDPAAYEAEVGEKLYVQTNRSAQIWLYGEEDNTLSADSDSWTAVTVSENNMGLHPTIGARDAYGNTAAVQLERIPMKDITAPALTVDKNTVSVSGKATEEEVRKKLLANIIYSDETTPADALEVVLDYNLNTTATRIIVTYTVTDEAGNSSSAQCWLRIRSGLEPEITVNGTEAYDGAYLYFETTNDLTLNVTFAGGLGEPYKLVYDAGNLTSWAKLKDGIYLTDGYTQESNTTFRLNDLEDGWYSFALVTQSMEVYYFQIHVGKLKG